MKSIRGVGPVVALALGVALVCACGGSKPEVNGKVVVEPEGRTQLVVTGNARTVLELDGRDGSTVEMQVDDGETRDFAAGNSYRKTFTGGLTIVFLSKGERPATIHFRATSPEAVDVKITQSTEDD